jgi:hypothetical protein
VATEFTGPMTARMAAGQTAATQFVDLSEQAAKAKIVRQGYDVPAVKFDAKKVDQFIGDLTQVPTQQLPRVVSQAVPPGTKVAAGTVIDLVLAPLTKIPFSVFEGVHLDLATKNLDAIAPLVADTAAKKTLLTYEAADQVPAAEKTHLQAAFLTVGITVDEGNPNKTFAKAFDSARGGLAFHG